MCLSGRKWRSLKSSVLGETKTHTPNQISFEWKPRNRGLFGWWPSFCLPIPRDRNCCGYQERGWTGTTHRWLRSHLHAHQGSNQRARHGPKQRKEVQVQGAKPQGHTEPARHAQVCRFNHFLFSLTFIGKKIDLPWPLLSSTCSERAFWEADWAFSSPFELQRKNKTIKCHLAWSKGTTGCGDSRKHVAEERLIDPYLYQRQGCVQPVWYVSLWRPPRNRP